MRNRTRSTALFLGLSGTYASVAPRQRVASVLCGSFGPKRYSFVESIKSNAQDSFSCNTACIPARRVVSPVAKWASFFFPFSLYLTVLVMRPCVLHITFFFDVSPVAKWAYIVSFFTLPEYARHASLHSFTCFFFFWPTTSLALFCVCFFFNPYLMPICHKLTTHDA